MKKGERSNLIEARREAARQIYLSLPPDTRSLDAAAEIVQAKLGGPGRRQLARWSVQDRWPEAAAEHDRQRRAQSDEPAPVNSGEALRRTIAQQLDVLAKTKSTAEQSRALNLIEKAARLSRDIQTGAVPLIEPEPAPAPAVDIESVIAHSQFEACMQRMTECARGNTLHQRAFDRTLYSGIFNAPAPLDAAPPATHAEAPLEAATTNSTASFGELLASRR